MKSALAADFRAKGDLYVFVDECHRTQSGDLHQAMKAILPNALFIGFTGTPLLKADKKKSIEVFGRYIHTYKFDEAVADKVVLDLRYEARDIDQNITSQVKIDQWFAAKTKGLNDQARAQLKTRWGTCNAQSRRIWLNLELAKKPVLCIEYIIVHELVHLIERHHNDRFLKLMDQYLPQWRQHRQELNAAPLAHDEWGY